MIQDKLIKDSAGSIKEAIKVLENSGKYKVVPLKKSSKNVTNDQVVECFYDSLNEKVGVEYYLALTIDKEKDFKALREYQKKAKRCGMTRFLANEKVCLMVRMVFKHYHSLDLHSPPDSLSYLLSKSGRWIIQKAVNLHQKHEREYEYSNEFRDYVNQLCSVKSDKVASFINSRHEKLRKIYKEMRGTGNAKEES